MLEDQMASLPDPGPVWLSNQEQERDTSNRTSNFLYFKKWLS